MAKFSVCRIYKVTLWLNFSYNYSVNLLQISHLYIHPFADLIPLPASILRNHRSYECASKSRIRYDFRGVARTIRCSVDTAKMRVKVGKN